MKLAALAAAWLAGLALAYRWYDADPVPALLLALFALVLALLCRLLRPSFPALTPWPALLLCLLLLGLWRYEVAEVTPPTLVTQDKGTVSLRGQVVSDPEATSTRIQFRLQVSEINRGRLGRGEADWAQQSGKVLVYAHPPATLVAEREHPYFRYGDRLELAGTLQRPQPLDGFDYPAYLESQGIYAIFWSQESVWLRGGESSGVVALLRAVSYDLRRKLARSLELSLPPSQAALAQALLLGLRGQLPDDVVENFRQTGTSHLLAISGLHLGILLALALGLLQRLLGRHTPFPLLLTLALIWLYVLVSGAPASVVRAAIMGSAYLAALGLGRPRDSLAPALGLSALAMTALEPGIVTQLSFQLSFAAMAGIVLALPWQEAASRAVAGSIARRYGLGHPVATPAGVALGWLAAGSIVSLAATLATFPLVSVHFQQLPLLGIPATLVATPLLPFALVGGLAAALAGLAHPLLGQGMGLLAAIPLSALLELVALVPGWTVSGQWVDARLAWAWYVALVLTLLLAGRGRRSGFLGRQLAPPGQDAHQAGWQRYAAARRAMGPLLTLAGAGLLLLAAAAYLAAGLLNGSDGKLHVYFFDVGQGDSILIVRPADDRF